jgi:thiamine biosynthesis protein ThiS
MKITVNNQLRDVKPDTTLAELIATDSPAGCGGTAAAVNGKIIRKPLWESCVLHDLDEILIIKAAYGG